MLYQTFDPTPQASYEIAILVPSLDEPAMLREYVTSQNLDPKDVIAYELYKTGKKTSATTIREYLDDLLTNLTDLGVRYLMVGDTDYFKALGGVPKAEVYLGYALPSAYPVTARGAFQVLYVPNYRQVFHNPGPTRAKITQAFDALWSHRQGRYRDPGCDIIAFADYPTEVADIAAWLQKLIEMDRPLSADIEGFSLKHHSAGIGSISFAWSKNEGIAFPVDLGPNPPAVRRLLMKFFREFPQKMVWHNISFDAYILVYQLFMEDICDTAGLLDGLEVMLKNWDCTKLITYLATNSCAGNELGLKVQAQEFSGNYAQAEIKDITKIPLPQLLQYNLVDTLSTWFVYGKHWDNLVADQQLEIYETLFKPAIWDIIQMQLTGLPVNPERVQEIKGALQLISSEALHAIQAHPLVQEMTHILDVEHVEARNAELKKKRIALGDEPQEFNPNSGPQMQRLLYELAGLPVIEKTDTGLSATGREVLEKLKAHTESVKLKALLDAFLEHSSVEKILTAFIPAMEAAVLGPDGCHYLFGNFNLGGTLSGRLSSSDPNLQNIPANVMMALSEKLLQRLEPIIGSCVHKGKLSLGKLIKTCFVPPNGWLFVGLDFASLEDRVSALTTKDPNKLKVYLDLFDGHSLRAYSYFSERMPDIEQAPDGARCFEAQIGDTRIWFHEYEVVAYLGQEMTGAELWERLANVRTAA